MHVVRVIPLAKMPATAPSVLDYFWPDPIARGCIARAPLGRRMIPVLVLESLDVQHAKLSLKKSAFALKKLDGIISATPQITETQLAMAQWLSATYAASLATCLATVAPPFLGKRGKTLPEIPAAHDITTQRPAPAGTIVISQPDTARLEIKRIITAATTGQIFILVPELSLADQFGSMFSEHSPVVVHSGMPKREYETAYRAVRDGNARIVIGTRLALWLPWNRLTHIIVEDPLNEAYKSDMAPRYNSPDAARQLAAHFNAQLTWLTPAISTVHHHLISTGALPCKNQKPHWPETISVSMEQERLDGGRSLFSRHAQDAILDAYESGQPVLVLSARRGYSAVARCEKCHRPVPCSACSVPMRWHRTAEDMLVCYSCAAYCQVPKQCPLCRAGAVRPAGLAGSQKIAEGINALLDRHGYRALDIPILDSDLVRTPAHEIAVLKKLDTMEHPVIVASQMIFSHRYSREFCTIIVPQLDALAYNPDYRTQERLILQLEKLADFRPRSLVVQSLDNTDILEAIAKRQWNTLYAAELAHRKALLWPPFVRVVKLSIRHRDKITAARLAAIAADRLKRAIAHLSARGTRIFGPNPALTERSNGIWTHNIILKSTLAGSRLSELLRYAPPDVIIDVDPRSIT